MNERTVAKLYTSMLTEYPDVLNVYQLCEVLGNIGTKTCYELLKKNKIPYIKIGREYRIPKPFIIKYLLQ